MRSTVCTRVATTVAALFLIAIPAASSADDGAVQIVEKRVDDTVSLTAKLTTALDVTMSITLDLENLALMSPLPAAVESDGKPEVPLVTLRVVDRHKPNKYGYRLEWKAGGRGKGSQKPYSYALPYKDGPHRVRQAFFGRFSHYAGSQDEYAIDWSMPVGTNVHAARGGIVAAFRSDVETGGPDPRYKKDYNYIVIRHDDGTYAEYLHLDKDGVKVALGDQVEQGDVIGLSGDTGYTSEPHLHFAVFNTISGRERRTIPIEFALPSGRRVTPVEGRSL